LLTAKAMKRRSDNDIILDVLEEAARRSYSDETFQWKQYGPQELPIVLDLIEENKVRGEVGEDAGGQSIALTGITLPGRQLHDELIEKRDAKELISRLKNIALLALGWIGGLMTAAIKAIIEHLLK
jgi:hypothetical protein